MNALLHEISWIEAKEYFAKNDLVVLPVGSNEQHGYHNPLGTDHLIAKELARQAAERAQVLCLQFIPFGISGFHKHFCGTIYISPRVYKEYVKDVCIALAYHGVKKIVIVNGHGGNRNTLLELALELREERIFVSIYQWWETAQEILPNIFKEDERGHAGSEETSLNLVLHPHLVKINATVDEVPRKSNLEEKGIYLPLNTIDMTKSGVYGKSSTASTEKGKIILETITHKLVKHLELLKTAKIDEILEHRKI